MFGNFKSPTNIDLTNLVFSLHYRITFWFLIACAVYVVSREIIKEHIDCFCEKKLKDFINSFCFSSTTLTVLKYRNSINNLKVKTHPLFIVEQDPIVRHVDYQWVPYVLVLQALMFYLPYFIWKYIENGRLEATVQALSISPLTASVKSEINGYKIESEELKNKVMLIKETYLAFSKHWARSLVVYETLNVVNLILQIMFVNMFLRGKFLNLGIEFIKNSNDIFETLFPKIMKCTFPKYLIGSLPISDTLCILSLNVINEQIYCILWFWFLVLFIVTFMGLISRLVSFLLHDRSPAFNKWIWGELSPGPVMRRHDIQVVTRKLSFSDCLFLCYLGKNINGVLFRRLMANIFESFQDS